MRNRYSIRQGIEIAGWAVIDNRLSASRWEDKVVANYSTRSEARAACNRLNASEASSREDQQQSREETI